MTTENKSLPERIRQVLKVEENNADGTFMQRASAIETATGFEYLGISKVLEAVADEVEELLDALEPFAAFAGPCVDANVEAKVDQEGWTDAGQGMGAERIDDWLSPAEFYAAFQAYLKSAGHKKAAQASLREDTESNA